MKYCYKCGKELIDEADVCTGCGIMQNDSKLAAKKGEDKRGFGWAFLGFIQPVIGLILYLIWKDDYPNRSKSCGIGALVSVICYAAFIVCYIIFIVGMIGSAFTWGY